MTTSKPLAQKARELLERQSRLDETLDRFPDLTRGLRGKIQESAWLDAKTVQAAISEKAREGRQLRVGIIGRVKAGKSSLLNALLFDGKDVLPKAATPMTASLTVLTYGEQPRAEIDPFTPDDVAEMARLAAEYDRELKARVEARLEAQAQGPVGRQSRPLDPKRIEQAIRRELDQDAQLGAAKDMHDRILQAGGPPAEWGSGQPLRLETDSIEALRDQLIDYVGANGRFTPFTNCLRLYLPLPGLKDLEVVDTPGINDPVPSRERRTYRELHRCDAVLVVSPAGQFLNHQDLELMDRLGRKEGVREVFLVASQADSQLFSSVQRQFGGELLATLAGLQTILANQARQILTTQHSGNPGVAQLLAGIEDRLVVTSSVAHSLLTQPAVEWDSNTIHIQQMLAKAYPAAFASEGAARENLPLLAGMKKTQGLLDVVRRRKTAIQAASVEAFLQDREQLLTQSLARAVEVLGQDRTAVETASSEVLEGQLKAMQTARTKGTKVVNLAVQQVAAEGGERVAASLSAAAQAMFTKLQQAAERAQGTEVESYKVDTPGFWAGCKRFFGVGGRETRTTTVQTIQAGEIRNALENFHEELARAQTEAVASQRTKLRQSMVRAILGRIREAKVLDDREIDGIALEQACLAAVGELRGFGDPSLPDLPEDLLRSGTLRGSAAERFDEAAHEYFNALRKAATRAGELVAEEYERRLREADVGTSLFGHYQEQIQLLKSRLKEKAETLKRYAELMACIAELRRGN